MTEKIYRGDETAHQWNEMIVRVYDATPSFELKESAGGKLGRVYLAADGTLTIETNDGIGGGWVDAGIGGGGGGGVTLPVVDTTGIVKGSSDATKIVRLEVDGLTTATTRVLTVQDADGTLALTGDNITSSQITSGTLTHERGGLEFDASAVAIGDVIAGTGTGTMAIIAASGASDGDVLTIQADGSVAFETGGNGDLVSTNDLSDVSDAATARQNLGLEIGVDVVAYPGGSGDLVSTNDLSDLNDASTARTNLGLEIGTDVQAYSAVLAATTASFLTADETKLDGIEALADVTDTANVTAAGALMDSEVDTDIKTLSLPASTTISVFGASLVDDAAASNARTTLGLVIGTDVQAYSAVLAATTASFTTADETKLDAITGTNTGDEPAASTTVPGIVELATIAEVDTGTDTTRAVTPDSLEGSALQTKVDGIEAGADVTDTTNVTAAGALMDSEVDADIKTLSLPASTTISAFGATLVDDASASAARTTLGLEIGVDVVAYPGGSGDLVSTNNLSDVSNAATARTNLGLEIGVDVQAYTSVLAATTSSFTSSLLTKLNNIENNAKDNQTGAEIKAAYEVEVNAFTDAQFTKLAGIETSADVTDATNVTAAGALMDSEVDTDIKTLSLPASTTISVFGASLVDDAAASNARTTLGLVIGTDVQAYSAVLAATTASFLTADETKLDGIEALADVTDTANVTAAGALMDSEVDADIKTLSLPASTTISAFGASLIDDAAASNARTTLGLEIGVDVVAYPGGSGDLVSTNDLSDVSDAATARTNLGLEIGVDVQAYPGGSGDLVSTNDLSDVSDAATARTNLGLEIGTDVVAYPGGSGDLVSTNDLSDVSDAATARTNLGLEIGTDVQAWNSVLDSTDASFTTTEESKLSGIEDNADVTDATNVNAAGAVMNTDTTIASMSFVVDEDTMASDLATKVPTQQSVKAYVDLEIAEQGSEADARALINAVAHASGGGDGDRQNRKAQLRGQSTTSSFVSLTADGGSDSATDSFQIPENSAAFVVFGVLGVKSGGSEVACYIVEMLVKRFSSTTTLVWSDVTVNYEDDSAWDVQVATYSLGIKIQGKGNTSETVNWTAYLRSIEVVE